MKISVIIVSHNTKNTTKKAIDSVYSQKMGKNLEMIVVDNASDDGSLSMLRFYKSKRGEHFKIIENKKNTGFSFANNQGIKVARGKYILLLNSDTKLKKGSLEKLLTFANKTKDAGVVGPKLLNGDGTLQKSCLNFPTIGNAIRQYWFGEKGLFEKYAPKTSKAIEVDSVVGAAFLITPKAIKSVGLLDERYWFYFEDIDYCRRVTKKNLKVYYLPQALVYHLHGKSGKKVMDSNNQWRRLIPSSKIYHGLFKHYLLTAIIWSGQKWQKLVKNTDY